MAAELKRGSLEGFFRGVEDDDKLNGFEDSFRCESLLAFICVIVGMGRPVIFCPGGGVGSPTEDWRGDKRSISYTRSKSRL